MQDLAKCLVDIRPEKAGGRGGKDSSRKLNREYTLSSLPPDVTTCNFLLLVLSAHGLTPGTQATYVLPGPRITQDSSGSRLHLISLTTRCHDVDHDTGGRTCLHSMPRGTVYLSESSIFLHDLFLFVFLQIALFVAAVRDLLPLIGLLVPPALVDVG